jgi:putative ABC transport system ATP-binding protein
MSGSPDIVFNAKGLTKVYRNGALEVQALRGIDFQARKGEFIVILGPSGSGKSTFLNIVGGLDRASGGEAWFEEHQLTSLSEAELTQYRRDHVGFVFQFYNLVPSLTARENVQLVTEIARRPMSADEALALVGLAERADHFPAQLSGGEQQRVAVARAIASSPSIVLADEPTAALDGENGHAVMALLARIAKEQNRSVLAVTHDPRTLGYADRVVRIEDGKIVGEERRPQGLDAPEITDLTKRRKAHA